MLGMLRRLHPHSDFASFPKGFTTSAAFLEGPAIHPFRRKLSLSLTFQTFGISNRKNLLPAKGPDAALLGIPGRVSAIIWESMYLIRSGRICHAPRYPPRISCSIPCRPCAQCRGWGCWVCSGGCIPIVILLRTPSVLQRPLPFWKGKEAAPLNFGALLPAHEEH